MGPGRGAGNRREGPDGEEGGGVPLHRPPRSFRCRSAASSSVDENPSTHVKLSRCDEVRRIILRTEPEARRVGYASASQSRVSLKSPLLAPCVHVPASVRLYDPRLESLPSIT